MDYYVRQNNGEYPKVSETELIAMIEAGQVSEDTQVRKALMPTWSKAGDIPALAAAFKNARKANDSADADPDKKEDSSAYENALIPERAGILLRFQAWFLDIVLLVVLFFIIAAVATGVLSIVGSHVNEGAIRIGGEYVNVTLRTDRTADRRGALVKERLRARKLAEAAYQEELAEKQTALRKAKKDRADAIAKARKERATRAEFEKIPQVPEIKFPKPPPVKDKVSRIEAHRAPTITDDAFEGCYAGTLWVNTKAKQTFVCITGKKNNAVWMTLPMVNSIANIALITFVLLGLILLVGALMLRAQTIGMWYFGIFLSDAEDHKKEVLELRAFCYWLISVFTFYLNPLFLLIKKPVPAELITRTRIISTISQKR